MTDSYDIFPKPQATKLMVFSAYSQYQRAAMAGYFVLTGCAVSRTSASEVAIASGTFANGGVSKTYAGGSVSSITAASSGKQKIGLIYIDGADDTAKIEYGTEQTPSNTDYFLENTLPLPPNLGDEDWAVLALVRITDSGITDTSFGDPSYASGSVANIRYSGSMAIDNSTITISNGVISTSNKHSKVVSVEVPYDDADGEVTLLTMPANGFIRFVGKVITTAYDDGSVTVGEDGDEANLMAAAVVDAQGETNDTYTPNKYYASGSVIKAFITPGSATEGTFTLILEYVTV